MDDDGPDYRQQQECEERELWERHEQALAELKKLREEMKNAVPKG